MQGRNRHAFAVKSLSSILGPLTNENQGQVFVAKSRALKVTLECHILVGPREADVTKAEASCAR